MPYSLNCIGCRLFRLAHFTLKYAFKDGHVFCLAHFFFSPCDLSLSECTRLYLSTYLLNDVLVFPMFWHLSIKLLETSMLRIPWRIYFQLHWVIAEDKIAGTYEKHIFNFERNSQTVFQSGCITLDSYQ